MESKTGNPGEILPLEDEILANLDYPRQLEQLYQINKKAFKKAFNRLYPDIREKPMVPYWHERLNFENGDLSWGNSKEWTFILVAAFLAGLVAKIPDFSWLDQDFFYPRNLGFIVFPFLSAYFVWKQKLAPKTFLPLLAVILGSAGYINLLPDNPESDTLILACIHLPLLLWAVLGISFVGGDRNNPYRRLDFLRYNGDLLVMTTIIGIAGALLTGVTIGLFELIDLKIEELYFHYFGIWGLAAAPILGNYLIQINPQLVKNVSPVIARVFTPLVLAMLTIYLVAVIYTGKDPFNDREFLLIFNALLIGVMAIILFSIAESSKTGGSGQRMMLFALSGVTILINGIALSAILFRISEWGITPNRLAVLGGNILMLINLLLVSYRLLKTIRNKTEAETVEKSIASYLPVYVLWALVVTFVFPVLFGFK